MWKTIKDWIDIALVSFSSFILFSLSILSMAFLAGWMFSVLKNFYVKLF